MEEIWKDIEEYEGLYQVSNMGRVKSLKRIVKHSSGGDKVIKEKILKFDVDKDEYLRVRLYREGEYKHFFVHRLVLMTFSPVEKMEELQINHKDENKQNNKLENLEFCTCKYNNNYGTRNQKVSQKLLIPVVQLDIETNELIKIWQGAMEAERQAEFNSSAISCCCNNKYTKNSPNIYKGYKWMHLEDYEKELKNAN